MGIGSNLPTHHELAAMVGKVLFQEGNFGVAYGREAVKTNGGISSTTYYTAI